MKVIITCAILLQFSTQHQVENSTSFTYLLDLFEAEIIQMKAKEAQMIYSQIIEDIPQAKLQLASSKPLLGRLYFLYGLFQFYALNSEFKDTIDFTKVLSGHLQFKDLGNKEAQFYLGLLGIYKLDGHFNVVTNIELLNFRRKNIFATLQNLTNITNSSKITENMTAIEWQEALEQKQKLSEEFDLINVKLAKCLRLESYTKYKHLSTSLIDFYFSALQGNNKSAIAMSFKFMHGLGTDKNCSNAVLFIHPLVEDLYIHNPPYQRYLLQNRRLDDALYKSQYFRQVTFTDPIHDSESLLSIAKVTSDNLQQFLSVGFNFYYGVNGAQRDYQQAYVIFEKIVEDTSNAFAKTILAQMIVEGIGIETFDYQEAAVYNESRGFNGIGYMYMNGLYVEKDVEKAVYYFKKAADYNNSDGHFNYGSLFLLPSTREIERNKRIVNDCVLFINTLKAYHHLNQAANVGHAPAQFSLALILLDGVDFYYSCELGVKLLHQAISRGPYSDLIKTGNYLLNTGKNVQSFIKYLEAATLGFHLGIVNGAILAEQFSVISNKDIEYHLLNEKIYEDSLFKIVNRNKLQLIGAKDPFRYYFKDYMELVGNHEDDMSFSAKDEFLWDLMVPREFNGRNINSYIANKLYGYCKIEKDAVCFLRYGDQYYYGVYEDQDYYRAYDQYKEAVIQSGTSAFVLGHAYFNLAYMKAYGEGTTRNMSKAGIYWNKSLTSQSLIDGLPIEYQWRLVEMYLFLLEQEIDSNTSWYMTLVDLCAVEAKAQLYEHWLWLCVMMLLMVLIFSCGYRLLLENKVSLQHHQE